MNEEEFKERVKKTFGNLLTTIKPSSVSNPLWSLTGGDVEKRQWRRDHDSSDRDNNPCASSFDDFVSCARKNSRKNLKNYCNEFENDDDDLNDDDGDDEKLGGLDDWDLRGSIGLDSTLDNEDEEDAFDKVAIGRENTGDRLYMGVVANKNVPNIVSSDDLSSNIGIMKRDPRANRLAAKTRLKEDDAEAEQHKTAHVPPTSAEKVSVPSSGDVLNVKPILKRKEHESTSKPSSKRVRFDPEYVNEGSASLKAEKDTGFKVPSDDTNSGNQSVLNERVSRVPDYVRNPSKYTRYTLDSTDETSGKSNVASCLDILHMVKNSQNSVSRPEQEDASADLPKSIPFVPKKKSDPAKADASHSESTHSTLVVGFIDEDLGETEVDDMEVDTSKKHGRQYRTKSNADEPE
ncbi:hypothetical protein RND81_10G026300 [Saponaria officinalis]|uniref:Protein TSSC4 n=1 Tax=Saponaria officinalis TaxID=3572 RepID=A0AAW1HXL4_SAPOF